MSVCNHIWRDKSMPTPKKSKEALLASVKNAGSKGWWLNGDKEQDYALQLIADGEIVYCKNCHNNRAVIMQKFNRGNEKEAEK